jgi:preprotein translocase subunit SecG
MATALLVLHLMIAAALVGVVLLQRSEGGALGMGGSGAGGFLTGRGTANLLTRTTAALAAAFFTTSILLTLLAQSSAPSGSILDKSTAPAGTAPSPGTTPSSGQPEQGRGGILDKLQQPQPTVPESR